MMPMSAAFITFAAQRRGHGFALYIKTINGMMSRRFVLVPWLLLASGIASVAQTRGELVVQLRVTLGASRDVGTVWCDSARTQTARRVVIPITGGTFEGPGLKGTILCGGADYQMVRADGSRTELDAIYEICTHDGTLIHVRNSGAVVTTVGDDGRRTTTFRTTPRFEVDIHSPYAWLGEGCYTCEPDFSQPFDGIVLNVFAANCGACQSGSTSK